MPRSDIKMRRALLTVITAVVLVVASSPPTEDTTRNVFGQCILPLGMEEGKIPDDAITASSSYETKSVGPQNARIRQEKNGGAWCPKAQISNAIREYLEIDLTRYHLITWTETQGRFGNGQGQEYAEAFFLEYWRDTKWHQYKNLKGDRVLRGNSNTYLVEKQKLDLPFVASRVRFVPYSQHPRTVCMRVEIYGCLWEQNVARYTAPQGARIGPGGCSVQDSSYDGIELETDSMLVNGLGQLTDGILGQISEILSSNPSNTNWVGWSDRDAVQLVFEFQELRIFENCSIHTVRLPELGVQMYSRVRIWFSVDGENYETTPEISETMSIDDNLSTGVVFSTSIMLQSRIGRFVKVELSLAAKWLLLSEITFYTVSGIKNPSINSYRSVDRSFTEERNRSELWTKSDDTMSVFNETDVYEILKDDGSTPDAFPVGTSQTYVGLVSGLLTVFVLSLTCTAFLIKQRGRNKVALLQKHTALLCDSSAAGIAISPKDVKLHNSIVNGLSLIRKPITSRTMPTTGHVSATAAATVVRADSIDNITAQPDRPHRPRINSQPTSIPNRRSSTVYERTYKLFSEEGVIHADTNPSTSVTDFRCTANFAKNTTTEYAPPVTALTSKKTTHNCLTGNTISKVHEGYYAATDIFTIKRRGEMSILSPFTPLHIRDKGVRIPRTLDAYNVPRISRHRLRILDVLGEGSFGLVHLCEAKDIVNTDMGSIQNRQTVIVRSLWRGVVDSLRIDFTKDMRVLATLRDPNMTKMLALVEEEPFGAVFEYSELGDLPTFLESREKLGNEAAVSYGDRVNFVRQIASGMKYLESINIPHSDLAARNCIVGHNLEVKVSDHAIYCSKYDHHYYVDAYNTKIPLRWMAWEAVILSTRSCQADVWSFAVTIWEIFTNCEDTPYSDLTAEQVVENCSRWCQREAWIGNGIDHGHNDEKHQPRVLSRPDLCSDDLYRVMNKCWSKRIEDRPTFEDIYFYLERMAIV